VAITTDVIAGFAGESESEFNESLAFVSQMNFAGGHVFTYSARPGTAATRMSDQVPSAIRKERNALLREVFEQSATLYQSRFVGKRLAVLWESSSKVEADRWRISGLTDNNLRVTAQAPRQLWNQITPVQLTGLGDGGLVGVLG
jgi:threonylcarbamoyladenosine tRNA methylthiotransferase MtaB